MKFRSFLLLGIAVPSVVARIPVYEETPMPGFPATYYPFCTEYNTAVFNEEVRVETEDCMKKTSYFWQSTLLPSYTERREFCACTDLIEKLQTVGCPRCVLYRGGAVMTYTQVVDFAFGLCTYNPSLSTRTPTTSTPTVRTSAPEVTTMQPSIESTEPANSDFDFEDRTTTTRPSVTTKAPSLRPTTRAPVSSGSTTTTKSTSSTKKSKAALIAGIAAGVVAVVAIIFGAFRCGRKRRNDEEKSVQATTNRDDVVPAMPLTPYDGEVIATEAYMGAITSPTAKAIPVTR